MVVDFLFVCFWLLLVIMGEVDTIPIKESWDFDFPGIKAESLFPAIQSLSRRTLEQQEVWAQGVTYFGSEA